MIRFKDFKTTLQYNDKLNTKFWRNEKLLGSVRSALMKIAKEWAEFANIPESSIKDIILVGGNANFNYTKYSDLDLHLLVDKSKIANCPDLLDDYLRDKKQLWSLTHDIKIYGHDVELYAQDISDPTPRNQGVFSLTKNTWVTKPVKEKVNLNDPLIKQKVASFIERIDSLIDTRSDDVEPLRKIKEKLREMRSSSIQRGGEFALENLVFKELRNLGYIDKINKHITKAKDQSLSLE
jgi:hypothetical protein